MFIFEIYENISHTNLKLFTTKKNIDGHVLLLILGFSRHLLLLIYIIIFNIYQYETALYQPYRNYDVFLFA